MDPIVLISILLNAITVILIIWLTYRFDKTITKLNPHIEEIAKLREELLKESKQALAQSVETANQIVKTTQASAAKASQFSSEFMNQIQNEIRKRVDQNITKVNLELQNSAIESVEDYQKSLMSLLNRQEAEISQVQSQLGKKAADKIEEIARVVPDEVLNVHTNLDKRIQDKLAAVEKEVEAYRKEQLDLVNEKIYKVVSEIAKKTIGRSLDISSHEELVMQALAKARKDKVL